MKFHPEALPPLQQRVLRQLGRVLSPKQFYLAGGTALALHLGHRRSVDLDWFAKKPIRDPSALASKIEQAGVPFVTTLLEPGTLYGKVSGVRISVMDYNYPMLEPLVDCAALNCHLASFADLAAMKIAAVAQRGAKKDFVDIYALGLRHTHLSEMLKLYQTKFSIQDIAHVLCSLNYFNDTCGQHMPRMFWKCNWRTIKKTIQEWVKDLAR